MIPGTPCAGTGNAAERLMRWRIHLKTGLEKHGRAIRPVVGVAVLLLAAGCGTTASRHSGSGVSITRKEPPSQVTRSEVMETALRYARHRWRGTEANARHGRDAAGIRVDTPDAGLRRHVPGAMPGYWVPGEPSTGVPYQWGGFLTPEEFDRDIAKGLAAGDIYTAHKRALLDDAVSREAAGIDCSGFVSRCWRLPRSFSTRELSSICDPLPSWEDLRPGDVLNSWNRHVVLFSGWMDPGHQWLLVYETGGSPDWKVIKHRMSRSVMKKLNFHPLRYRGIRDS